VASGHQQLILPGTFLAIKDVLDLGAGLQMIQMVDEASPPLMDFFHPQLCAAKTSPSLVNSFGNMVVAPHGRLAAPGGTSPAIPMQLDEDSEPVSTKASKPLFAPLSLQSPDSLAKAALTIMPPTKGYTCKDCNLFVLAETDIESDQYQWSNGPAYLVRNLQNCSAEVDKARTSKYTSGEYTICDVKCVCGNVLGNKYLKCPDAQNHFKIGKFLVDCSAIHVGIWSNICKS
jgi:hypothetical protein